MSKNLLSKSNLSFLIWLLFLSLLQGCYTNPTEKLFEEQNLINSVRKKAATRIEKKYNLKPIGTGARALHEIKMLGLAFRFDKKIDIREGRELLVAAVEILLDEVNKEEKIRPYLANYPFTVKNVEVRIFINSSAQRDLSIISSIDGIMEYQKNGSSPELLKTVYRETFEEASEKLL